MRYTWRNNVIEGLGILLSVIGIIISINQNSSSLAYKIVDSSSLIRPGAISQEWKLTYKGREVSDPKLTIYKITNSGATPIEDTDHKEPISIDLGEGASILEISTAVLTYSQGEEISRIYQGIYQDSSEITLNEPHVVKITPPLLLNPKESLLLKIISENTSIENLNVPVMRVPGVTDVVPLRSEASLHYIPLKSSRTNLLLLTTCISILFSVLVGLWIRRSSPFSRSDISWLSVKVFVSLWAFLGLCAIV